MKKVFVLVLVVAVLAGGWLLLKRRAAAEPLTPKEETTAHVETARIEEKPIAQTLEAFGVIASSPSGERVITARFECSVRSVKVATGARVAAGDVLLEIAPSPEARLAYESARSSLALANRGLVSAQERFDLKLATSQDLLTAQQTAEEARLKSASFEARGLGTDGKIVAREAGVVSKLDVSSGALIAAGAPLVTISTDGQLECRVAVEGGELANLAVGQPVTLLSAGRTAADKISTTIRFVGAALDPVSGAGEARATLPAGAALLLGEHVRASIEIKKKDRALVVPRSAVLPVDDKLVMFTVKAGKAVKHEVTLGLVSGDFVEVLGEGLSAGDAVVTLGNYELENGTAVALPEAETPVATATKKEPRS